MALNIAIYAASWAFSKYGLSTLGALDIRWGANWGPFTLGGQWWRLSASTFVHGSIGHLLDNMLGVWIFGRHLERILGRWSFLAFYLVCGIAGALASVSVHTEERAYGASGAVFAIVGGLIAAYVSGRLGLSLRSRFGLAFLILYTAYGIYAGMRTSYVDNAGHIAGLIIGAVLGSILLRSLSRSASIRRSIWVGVAATVVLATIIVRHYNRYVIPLAPALQALDRNDLDRALKEIDKTLQLKPNDALANTLQAEIYVRKGDLSNAQLSVDRALASDHRNRVARLVQAKLYVKWGRFQEAMETVFDLERSGHLGREGWQVLCDAEDGEGDHTEAGNCYLDNEQADQAITAFQQALLSNPNDHDAQIGMAKAYQAKGMSKEAQAAAVKAAETEADRKK